MVCLAGSVLVGGGLPQKFQLAPPPPNYIKKRKEKKVCYPYSRTCNLLVETETNDANIAIFIKINTICIYAMIS